MRTGLQTVIRQSHLCSDFRMVSLGRSVAFLSAYARSPLILTRRPFLLSSGLTIASSFVTASTTTTTTTTNTVCEMKSSTGYLNAEDAAALDGELMSTPGFSLEQLMELAGLSVAEAVYQVVPPDATKTNKILLVCGPGNNGGDGLVAARHLVMFGYECVVVYPKQSSKQHFINLVQQCRDVGIDVLEGMPDDFLKQASSYSAVVDAIFGFSFRGEPREPFKSILLQLKESGVPVVSVDIPSGWNVDDDSNANHDFMPTALISLTAPKLSAKSFTGRHFVGGRFLPPKLAQKYNISMPPYPGVSQVMEVSNTKESWEEQYHEYLKEKEARLSEPSRKEDDDDESWRAQYAAYLAEKEAKERESK